jgi:predicted O-methyltransferase YrrM
VGPGDGRRIEQRWIEVDEYVGEMLLGSDPVLEAALASSSEAGLPPIAVSPPQGRFLNLLARVHGARSILELGTLGGYSTIWLARALGGDGRLVTLELEPRYAEVAQANVARAGLAELVELRVGPAADSMRSLIGEGAGPFDLIFIDADKQGTPEYFELALDLSRPGGLILVDNVVRDGSLVDTSSDDSRALGMRRFHELASAQPRVEATTIQTVGGKGYDGFTLMLVDGARAA